MYWNFFQRGCMIFLTTFTTITTVIFFFKFTFPVFWHIWQPMWCSQGSVLRISRCLMITEHHGRKVLVWRKNSTDLAENLRKKKKCGSAKPVEPAFPNSVNRLNIDAFKDIFSYLIKGCISIRIYILVSLIYIFFFITNLSSVG